MRSCPLSTQPKYATQGATHRRTEEAILISTKNLIAQCGLSKISMIEIAQSSEVSRATLYNHFRDKSAVITALINYEVEKMIHTAQDALTPAAILESLSLSISSDEALATMREHDKAALAELLTRSEDPLYLKVAQCVHGATKTPEGTGIAMRWLMGQVAQPITPDQSRTQAERLIAGTLI